MRLKKKIKLPRKNRKIRLAGYMSETSVTESELELFSKFGPLAEIYLPLYRVKKQSLGFAFISYLFAEHAVTAFSELDGTVFQFHHLPLYLEWAPIDSLKEPPSKEDKSDEVLSNNSCLGEEPQNELNCEDKIDDKYFGLTEQCLTKDQTKFLKQCLMYLKFSNLFKTVYNKGNLLFTPDGNTLISPVGNRTTLYNLRNHKSETLPIESRYNFSTFT